MELIYISLKFIEIPILILSSFISERNLSCSTSKSKQNIQIYICMYIIKINKYINILSSPIFISNYFLNIEVIAQLNHLKCSALLDTTLHAEFLSSSNLMIMIMIIAFNYCTNLCYLKCSAQVHYALNLCRNFPEAIDMTIAPSELLTGVSITIHPRLSTPPSSPSAVLTDQYYVFHKQYLMSILINWATGQMRATLCVISNV